MFAHFDRCRGCRVGQTTLAVFGRIAQRSQRVSRLVLAEDFPEIADFSSAPRDLIMELVSKFWGAYVAFVFRGDEITVFRDPSGAIPCLHARDTQGAIFFSDIGDVAGRIRGQTSIDLAALARRWLLPKVSMQSVPLTGVTEILPGQAMVSGTSGLVAGEVFWRPVDFAASPVSGTEEALLLMEEALDEVATFATGQFAAPIVSIGGLDSSLIWGLGASRCAELQGLNLYSSDRMGDERQYVAQLPHQGRISYREMDGTGLSPELVTSQPHRAYPPAFADFIDVSWRERAPAHLAGASLISGVGGDNIFMQDLGQYGFVDMCHARDWRHGFFSSLLSSAVHRKSWVGSEVIRGAWHGITRPNARTSGLKFLTSSREGLGREWIGEQGMIAEKLHPGYDELDRLAPGKSLQILASCYVPTEYYPYFGAHAYEQFDFYLAQPIVEVGLRINAEMHGQLGMDRFIERRIAEKHIPRPVAFRHSKSSPYQVYKQFLIENRENLSEFVLSGLLVGNRLIDEGFAQHAFSTLGLEKGHTAHVAFQLCAWEGWSRNWD